MGLQDAETPLIHVETGLNHRDYPWDLLGRRLHQQHDGPILKTLQERADHTLDRLCNDGLQIRTRALETEQTSDLHHRIIGKEGCDAAALIENLRNADWVRQGLAYLPERVDTPGERCPFCQERTITPQRIADLSAYFDETYRADIAAIQRLQVDYRQAFEALTSADAFTQHPFAEEIRPLLEKLHGQCLRAVEKNLNQLQAKLRSPSEVVSLEDTRPSFSAFNVEIGKINEKIARHNQKLANRAAHLQTLKDQFWTLQRWEYDQTLARYQADEEQARHDLKVLAGQREEIGREIGRHRKLMAAAQKQTVNIEQAIDRINAGLVDLGIEDFRIVKHSETLYRVVRPGSTDALSPHSAKGEKMIISFLYSCELCLGRRDADDVAAQRIVVIDDPISSLSHIYVFSVGRLIRRLFIQSERGSQIFVMTHSLYFLALLSFIGEVQLAGDE